MVNDPGNNNQPQTVETPPSADRPKTEAEKRAFTKASERAFRANPELFRGIGTLLRTEGGLENHTRTEEEIRIYREIEEHAKRTHRTIGEVANAVLYGT